ncbi:MAG: tetratricopeptide repeat protein [Kiritimatiellaceae bacterium]|nr:tetratricopeptide repeat protein [Kiritimatiellaceae bacterium]
MKKIDTDIRDIYRAKDLSSEAGAMPEHKVAELIERSLRRQQIFNLSVGLLTLALVTILVFALVEDFLLGSAADAPVRKKSPGVPAYTLPEDEQWVLEYRQVAVEADGSARPGPKEVSTKWIKNAAYHAIMGELALRQGEPETAQNHFQVALETFPSMTGIRGNLGIAYLKQQSFEKAAEQLQKALTEGPSIAALNNLGVARLGLGEYEQAESVLRQALQQQPALSGCYKNLALLYQKSGRTNDAVGAFEKYLSLNPQDTPILEHYVSYLTAAGRLRDAIGFLERIDGADSLAVHLLLAETAARDADAKLAVQALRHSAQFLSPRQTIVKMHEPAFEKIAKTEPFETLLYQLELATVSLSTNLPAAETAP